MFRGVGVGMGRGCLDSFGGAAHTCLSVQVLEEVPSACLSEKLSPFPLNCPLSAHVTFASGEIPAHGGQGGASESCCPSRHVGRLHRYISTLHPCVQTWGPCGPLLSLH